MNEFKELQSIASEQYSSEELKKWLFSHTRDETEYQQLRRAMRTLAKFHPVEWKGVTGERVAVECNGGMV